MEVLYVDIILVVGGGLGLLFGWIFWLRDKTNYYAVTFIEMVIITTLIITWGVLKLSGIPASQYFLSVSLLIFTSGYIYRVIKKRKRKPFREIFNDIHKEEYGFRAFVAIIGLGFIITAFARFIHSLTENVLMIIFVIMGLLVLYLGVLGCLYSIGRSLYSTGRNYIELFYYWMKNKRKGT